jgi:hypothetical protein
MAEPANEDVAWLAGAATGGDLDRAAWELRYLRRALALLVAQRDALDDRTASEVAREIAAAMQADRQVAAAMVKLAERQFNERLSAYREMMALRGLSDTPRERVARTLLLLSGCVRLDGDQVEQGAAMIDRWMHEAATSLRASFGEARLPAGPAPEGH